MPEPELYLCLVDLSWVFLYLNFLLFFFFFTPWEFYHPQLPTAQFLSLFSYVFVKDFHAVHLVVTLLADRVNSCFWLAKTFVILEIPIASCSPFLFVPGWNVPLHSSQWSFPCSLFSLIPSEKTSRFVTGDFTETMVTFPWYSACFRSFIVKTFRINGWIPFGCDDLLLFTLSVCFLSFSYKDFSFRYILCWVSKEFCRNFNSSVANMNAKNFFFSRMA